MLNKDQQQFLRYATNQFNDDYKIQLNNLSFFNFTKKKELKELISR